MEEGCGGGHLSFGSAHASYIEGGTLDLRSLAEQIGYVIASYNLRLFMLCASVGIRILLLQCISSSINYSRGVKARETASS